MKAITKTIAILAITLLYFPMAVIALFVYPFLEILNKEE